MYLYINGVERMLRVFKDDLNFGLEIINNNLFQNLNEFIFKK